MKISNHDQNQFDLVPDAEYEEFSMLYVCTVENSFVCVYMHKIQPEFFVFHNIILFNETIIPIYIENTNKLLKTSKYHGGQELCLFT